MEKLAYPFIDYFLRSLILLGPMLAFIVFNKKSLLAKFFILWLSFYFIGLLYGEVFQIYLKWELATCNANNGITSPDQTAQVCSWVLDRISSDTGRTLFPVVGIFTGFVFALLISIFLYSTAYIVYFFKP